MPVPSPWMPLGPDAINAIAESSPPYFVTASRNELSGAVLINWVVLVESTVWPATTGCPLAAWAGAAAIVSAAAAAATAAPPRRARRVVVLRSDLVDMCVPASEVGEMPADLRGADTWQGKCCG